MDLEGGSLCLCERVCPGQPCCILNYFSYSVLWITYVLVPQLFVHYFIHPVSAFGFSASFPPGGYP